MALQISPTEMATLSLLQASRYCPFALLHSNQTNVAFMVFLYPARSRIFEAMTNRWSGDQKITGTGDVSRRKDFNGICTTCGWQAKAFGLCLPHISIIRCR
jgi:hypothetical protein